MQEALPLLSFSAEAKEKVVKINQKWQVKRMQFEGGVAAILCAPAALLLLVVVVGF